MAQVCSFLIIISYFSGGVASADRCSVMATTTERVLAAVVLMTVRFVYCSAQTGGCSPPAGILMTGDDKLGNNVPTILSNVGAERCKLILLN